MIRTPAFWYNDGASWQSFLLKPLAAGYDLIRRLHYRMRTSNGNFKAEIPVICIGNITAGGAGKTPFTLALYDLLVSMNYKPVILSRGYGGHIQGPVCVDLNLHHAGEVGDEALMMAQMGKYVWIAKNRLQGVKAVQKVFDVILMDDGFQNPTVQKDINLLVIDGNKGLGNGQMIPAGPLREDIGDGFRRANAFVVMGPANKALKEILARHGDQKPVVQGIVVPDKDVIDGLRGRKVSAFAGIGMPDKFFDMLKAVGIDVTNTYAFADHHPYQQHEILNIINSNPAALVVTTYKDFVRIPEHLKPKVQVVPIQLEIDKYDKIKQIIKRGLE